MASHLEHHHRLQRQPTYARLLPSAARRGSRCLSAIRSHAHGFTVPTGTAEESRVFDLRHSCSLWLFRRHFRCRYRWAVLALELVLLDRRPPHSHHTHSLDLLDSTPCIAQDGRKHGQDGLPRCTHHRLRSHPHSLRHHRVRSRPFRLAQPLHRRHLHPR